MSDREIDKLYRYKLDYTRKPLSFEEVDQDWINRVPVSTKDANELGVYYAEDLEIERPMDTFAIPTPLVFVINYDDKTYIVNTEGFNYCRYVAPCDIVD